MIARHTNQSTAKDLRTLVADLDLAVRSTRGSDTETIDAVGSALRPALSAPDLLMPEQRSGDPAAYRSHLLHVASDGAFSVVVLVWLPGQATAIHDHLAWCVVGVYEGVEHETRYRLTDERSLVESGSAVAMPGDVAGLLPPGDIHKVHNAGRSTAISLHVYGADLSLGGSSIRRTYPAASIRNSRPRGSRPAVDARPSDRVGAEPGGRRRVAPSKMATARAARQGLAPPWPGASAREAGCQPLG